MHNGRDKDSSGFEEGSYSRLIDFCIVTLGLRVMKKKKMKEDRGGEEGEPVDTAATLPTHIFRSHIYIHTCIYVYIYIYKHIYIYN